MVYQARVDAYHITVYRTRITVGTMPMLTTVKYGKQNQRLILFSKNHSSQTDAGRKDFCGFTVLGENHAHNYRRFFTEV